MKQEYITLNDIGLTQYEFLGRELRLGNLQARWYWDSRFLPPGKEDIRPLDETILEDIDNALDTRIYHRKKAYHTRWRSVK